MTKLKCQNKKLKFCHLCFDICRYFVICALVFVNFRNAYALNLDKVKAFFSCSDYKAAIKEGEKILAVSSAQSYGLDELYYILGMSYLEDGNYLRASDIFEIIINEFKDSPFKKKALVGLEQAQQCRDKFRAQQEKRLR